MSTYNPDRWVMVSLSKDQMVFYKIFATWAGGYLGSDSWQLNSGVTQLKETKTHYLFTGSSGSVYKCGKNSYGSTGYGHGVLGDLISKALGQGMVIEVLPGETNFHELNYDQN